jgi:hypothetical protein
MEAREDESVTDRSARGRAVRAQTPRSSQATLEVAEDRDPIALLEAQNASRVSELVPIRYGRMLASPLAFFRGAATVMAHDLAATPTAALRAQLSGDAHLLNFGGFASPERDLVFDLNDFDETFPGPFDWDVKRLAASFEIASRHRALTDADRAQAVLGVVRAYREAMQQFATMGDLDVWYSRLDAHSMLNAVRAEHDTKLAKKLQRVIVKAQSNDGRRALATLTRVVDGQTQIVSEPPLIVPLPNSPMRASRHPCRRPSGATATRCRTNAACCSSASDTSISRARSLGSAASARAAGCCCFRAGTSTIRCSCRSRRRRLPCSNRFSA